MNNKGFTLVELLGVILILSIIMLIAIPNITSILERTKKDNYIADCKKLVSLVQYELRKGVYSKPNSDGGAILIKLGDLATDDIVRDSDGYEYDSDASYVMVANEDGFLVYYVQLLAPNGKGDFHYKGIVYVDSERLDDDDRYQLYKNDYYLYQEHVD